MRPHGDCHAPPVADRRRTEWHEGLFPETTKAQARAGNLPLTWAFVF
ncbi:hypothetical protein [Pseudonocardia alni]|nr:hypothetical protein [Pseudonocardia alni]